MSELNSHLKLNFHKLGSKNIVKFLSVPVVLLSLTTLIYLVRQNQDIREKAQISPDALSAITNFTYNGEGQRLSKTTSEGTTWYPNALMEVQKDSHGNIKNVTRNYYFGGKLVAVRKSGEEPPSFISCGDNITVQHSTSNGVAPINTTITYGTVASDLSGTGKCWITKNLGATEQPNSSTDSRDTSAGWYWQFNRKQGYQYINSRVPSVWVSTIDENSNWTAANDPCTLELGASWRLPTMAEWSDVVANGSWNNYSDAFGSVLKLHAAGLLRYSDGSLSSRGTAGYYHSSTQQTSTSSYRLFVMSTSSGTNTALKTNGYPVRCIYDDPSGATTPIPTKTPSPTPSTAPTRAPFLTPVPTTVPTSPPTPTPTPCNVIFSPPSSITQGESVSTTAWVTTASGKSVDRVTFSSSNPQIISVYPTIDSSYSYKTTLSSEYALGSASISAKVYLSGSEQEVSCSASRTVSVVAPTPTSSSCLPSGTECTTNSQCCSGVCDFVGWTYECQ